MMMRKCDDIFDRTLLFFIFLAFRSASNLELLLFVASFKSRLPEKLNYSAEDRIIECQIYFLFSGRSLTQSAASNTSHHEKNAYVLCVREHEHEHEHVYQKEFDTMRHVHNLSILIRLKRNNKIGCETPNRLNYTGRSVFAMAPTAIP